MKKIFLLLVLFSIGAITFSQGISVRFIGRINEINYCRLDSVAVTNITRNWTETVVYPDTIIVLGGTVGTNLNIATSQGLGQNIPNPFDCETRVELSVSQRENVRMLLLDVSGKVYAEYNNSLDAGVHTFDISAAAPQTYILNATIGNRSHSIRMVNTGSGCGSSIKYAGISGSIISKQTWDNESQIGDNMRYIGYTNIGGNILESEPVQQPLRESQEVVLSFRSGSTGILNGHYWVDLGLPSGTKWATCNIGATSPEGYGDYFAWAETEPKETYNWSTYRYCNGSSTTLTKYCNNAYYGNNGFTDALTILEASDDAATANWGSGWRMPTYGELKELKNNCTVTRTTQNGVNGRLFTGPNGNSIFLPAAGVSGNSYVGSDGVFWSSSLCTDSPCDARNLDFISDYYGMNILLRYNGHSVRAVTGGGSEPPMVTTSEVYNITATGATLSGKVTYDGGANVIARGFLYGTSENNFTQILYYSAYGVGRFTATLTDLTSNTTYYYKAFACNSAGTAYGEIMSFTTPSLPTVTTGTASSITAAGATLSGNVTSDGGATVTAHGFLYGTNASNLTQTVQSGSGTGGFTKVLTDLTSGTTYYYKAYATNAVGTAYGEVMSFTTRDLSEATGYTNGYGYVDLGLPSGIKWATCNVGASTPTAYGNYFAWGETTTKNPYDWSTYRYCNGSTYKLTKYCNYADYGNNGFTDNLTTLQSSDDAATANWGSGWRMPTKTEMLELIDNCIVTWTTQNGVNGRLFTGPNGNSIFLPAAGYRYYSELYDAGSCGRYWSSSLYSDDPYFAWHLDFDSGDYGMYYFRRLFGVTVRAVCSGDNIGGDANISVPTVTTGTASSITTTGAILSGNVTSDGGATVTARGFLYGTNSSNLTQTIQCGDGTGDYTANLTYLMPSTTYYYKAYATNRAGTAYGEVMSFMLLDIVLPTVQTNAAGNITATDATISGNVTSDGGATVTARGFLYGTNSSNLTQTVQSGSGTGSFTKALTGLTSCTTYYYKAYATNSAGTAYGEVRSFTTENIGATTGTLNGYNWVDLGLPSGTRWATCNVGATNPEDYGNRYAWGETTVKEIYTDDNYTYSDNPATLPASADAATANWGSDWRMPTQTEMNELLNNCNHFRTTQNNVDGCLFTGPNGNSIFLPVTAYWSSSLGAGESNPWVLSGFDVTRGCRYCGFYVRAVCNGNNIEGFIPTVTTGTASDITITGATLSGNVTYDGGTAVTVRGFLYDTNATNLTQTVRCGSGTGDYTANLTGLTSGTIYYYRAYATNSTGTIYGEVRSFITSCSEPIGYVNGYGYVDLGLPSGTRWATCNIGASTPTAYGYYFAWGETTTKEIYNWSTYGYCNGNYNTLTKYCNDTSYGNNSFADNLTILQSSDDAATANWGSGWRMPTETEMRELYNNCTHVWVNYNGVSGCMFNGTNGNSIFLPATGFRHDSSLRSDGSCGYYWSSSLDSSYPVRARYLDFASYNCYMDYTSRSSGLSVRPICNGDNIGGDANISVPTVITGTASSITATGVTLSGNVTLDGGATVTARGFLYGTNASNLTQTVQSGSGTGSFTSALTGLTSGTTYYYKAYATNSAGTAYGEVRLFVPRNSEVTTGTLNGHDLVDLGLPSGTRWATCNVGATNPEDYGNYYAWGETVTKTTYNNYNYASPNISNTTLSLNSDAAFVNWGSGWRIPTYDEMEELNNNCTVIWTTQNGVNGRLFTGPNGNSIFLPAAGCRIDSRLSGDGSYGYYWSSSLYSDDTGGAWYLFFYSDNYSMYGDSLCLGYTVRPVCNQ